MIIVSLTGAARRDIRRQIRSSAPFADLFELRLDLIDCSNLRGLVRALPKPFIATCRPVWEGGAFRGYEEDRLALLEEALGLGAAYADIEYRAGADTVGAFVGREDGKRTIVSFHAATHNRVRAERIYRKLHVTGAEVIKFAFPARDCHMNSIAFEFLALAKRDHQRAVAIAMGEAGEPSRILYKKFGGWATFAGTEDGMTAAPGQIPASELKTLYRSDHMTASTKVFGVVGHPLGQSKGVYVHNALFKTRGLNSVYCKFPVKNLNRFMARVAPFLQGFSVTLPHKTAIMRFLDGVDPAARAIGAVNTVMRRSKKLFGTNTDAPGALDAIEKRMHVRGKTVLIIGAGGAAKAIAFEAQRRGATIVIANRTVFKARRLARSLGASYVALNNIGGCDVLVNATSVGMIPHVSDTPVPRKSIRAEVVFDAVYNPPRTRLLRDAEAKGAAIIPGTEMYLNQGVRQAKLFTGKDPDVGLMRKILKERLG